MTLETLVILALAAWRVAHLLVNERGLLAIGERVRALVGVVQVEVEHAGYNNTTYKTTDCTGTNEIARMLCCIYCTSVNTSWAVLLPWFVGTGLRPSVAEAIVWWLAIAALCMLLEKANRYV